MKEVKSLEEIALEYPTANNFAYVANRKYGVKVDAAIKIYNKAHSL